MTPPTQMAGEQFSFPVESPVKLKRIQDERNEVVKNKVCSNGHAGKYVWYTGHSPYCNECKKLDAKHNRDREQARKTRYNEKKKAAARYSVGRDQSIIDMYYARADLKTRQDPNGFIHVVDHIIALDAGGLDHQDNMQVITNQQNLIKGNKIAPHIKGERLQPDGSWV
jgi:5-methylcytosine-specific restriction endonuclease McrA